MQLENGSNGTPDILDKVRGRREGNGEGGEGRERERGSTTTRDLITISEVLGVSNWKPD